MSPRERPHRRRSCLFAGAAALLASADSVLTSHAAPRIAGVIAAQRIPAGAARTLSPAALSHDGRLIAYVARSPHAARRPCCSSVYVLDTATGQVTEESAGPDGTLLTADSQGPSLSADGGTLAFETFAPSPAGGQLHSIRRQVAIRDRRTGTLRTPVGSGGEEPNGDTVQPAITGDGLAVAFTSDATNLVGEPDANGPQTDVFLWRPAESQTVQISAGVHGERRSGGASHSPSVSGRGDLVAFVSTARLTADDTNDVSDVYLRDVRRGLTTLVSRGPGGLPADGASYAPSLSADGRYVAFVSDARNLPTADRNRVSDVYLHDRESGSTVLVSATSSGAAANAASGRPALSADGRYVVFPSLASNLGSRSPCPRVTPDRNLLPDVYLFDRVSGCATRLSGSPATEWWTPSVAPAISGDGAVVVFSSTQPMSDADLDTAFDLFHIGVRNGSVAYYYPCSPPEAAVPLTDVRLMDPATGP